VRPGAPVGPHTASTRPVPTPCPARTRVDGGRQVRRRGPDVRDGRPLTGRRCRHARHCSEHRRGQGLGRRGPTAARAGRRAGAAAVRPPRPRRDQSDHREPGDRERPSASRSSRAGRPTAGRRGLTGRRRGQQVGQVDAPPDHGHPEVAATAPPPAGPPRPRR
jgi:hypothetical protein